jgi:hypothetical protein
LKVPASWDWESAVLFLGPDLVTYHQCCGPVPVWCFWGHVPRCSRACSSAVLHTCNSHSGQIHRPRVVECFGTTAVTPPEIGIPASRPCELALASFGHLLSAPEPYGCDSRDVCNSCLVPTGWSTCTSTHNNRSTQCSVPAPEYLSLALVDDRLVLQVLPYSRSLVVIVTFARCCAKVEFKQVLTRGSDTETTAGTLTIVTAPSHRPDIRSSHDTQIHGSSGVASVALAGPCGPSAVLLLHAPILTEARKHSPDGLPDVLTRPHTAGRYNGYNAVLDRRVYRTMPLSPILNLTIEACRHLVHLGVSCAFDPSDRLHASHPILSSLP